MSDIEWVEAPLATSGRWNSARRDEVRSFAATLRENPGRWAVYPWTENSSAARTAASRIARGRNTIFGGGFDAVSRLGVVYVRYNEEEAS